jgi:hypothetical protein
MSLDELSVHRGATVQIKVNGRAALGVLGFLQSGTACVTSLCFLDSKGECPLMEHIFSEEEIAEIHPDERFRFASKVSITTE